MWFRVELHKDGSIKDCREVEAAHADGRHVYYVNAQLKEYAISSAQRRYHRYLDRQKEDMAARRAARKAAGLCRDCQAPVTDGRSRCAKCIRHEYEVRYLGKPPQRRGQVRPEVMEQRLIAAGRSERALILGEVFEQALRMRAGVAFISWLRNELHHARSVGKVAAAE